MLARRLRSATLLFTLALAACGGDAPEAKKAEAKKTEETRADAEPADAAGKKPRPRARASEQARVAEPKGRVVAIGALLGNLAATRSALKAAGAIDDAGKWVGGDLVVVQLGNQLGPGKEEKAVLALLDDLAAQAQAAGGALHRLTGEHEILNVALNFEGIVGPQGFKDYSKEKPSGEDPRIDSLPAPQRGRAAVFASGGAIARKLAEQKLVLIAGDTVFAHAGLLEEHVQKGIDTINDDGKKWMLGEVAMMPDTLAIPGPARTPKLRGNEPFCGGVEQALADLAVKRMVIARPAAEKIEAVMCEGKLIRVGGAAGDASGGPEVLEIAGDAIKLVPVPGK